MFKKFFDKRIFLLAVAVIAAFVGVLGTSSPVEIGSLTVSAAPASIPIYVPPISRAFLAEFQFKASAEEDIEMREFTVGLSAPGCEQWLDNFGFIDPTSGMWIFGPVKIETASPILLQGIIAIPKGATRTLTAIADIKDNAPDTSFNLTIFEIQARGLDYGFDVPVFGLPCTGQDVIIQRLVPIPTGFYGYVTDISGKPLKATVLAVNEPLKQKTKVVSGDDGYYEMTGLISAMHWLFCYKQYYYIDVAREFLPAGKMVRVDFVLLEKPQPPKPPPPPK